MSLMTIAVSALLKTPLPIIAAVRVVSGGFIFLAVAVWFGIGVAMELPHKILTVVMCLSAATSGIYYSHKLVKSVYISISPIGTVTFNELCSGSVKKNPKTAEDNETVELLPGTTVWPHFIILRLALASGRIVYIPIMKGQTPEQDFRSLAVACRWILRQNDPAQGTKS